MQAEKLQFKVKASLCHVATDLALALQLQARHLEQTIDWQEDTIVDLTSICATIEKLKSLESKERK